MVNSAFFIVLRFLIRRR